MKTIIPLFLLTILTGCASVHKDPVNNPQSLTNDDLIKTQIERIAKLERDMEKREQELKYQHLKELQTVQLRQAQQAPNTVNTSCKFFCF